MANMKTEISTENRKQKRNEIELMWVQFLAPVLWLTTIHKEF